jgi:hypothetical protein
MWMSTRHPELGIICLSSGFSISGKGNPCWLLWWKTWASSLIPLFSSCPVCVPLIKIYVQPNISNHRFYHCPSLQHLSPITS